MTIDGYLSGSFLMVTCQAPFTRREPIHENKYTFVNGEIVEIDASDEWASVIQEIEHVEQMKNRAETRRHHSLDALSDMGVTFSDPKPNIAEEVETYESYQEHQTKLEQLRLAISELLPQQQDIIKKIFFDGQSMVDVGRDIGITKQAVLDRVKKIKSRIKKNISEK